MKVEVKEKYLFSVHCNMMMISALSSWVKCEGDSWKWLMCACAYAKGGETRGVERKSPQVCWQSGDVSRKSALVFAKT